MRLRDEVPWHKDSPERRTARRHYLAVAKRREKVTQEQKRVFQKQVALYEESSPKMDKQLNIILEISGINMENAPWGDAFEKLKELESPGMALYCLYVVMGYPEVHAYRTVMNGKSDNVPHDWMLRSKPYIATLLARFMPSRTRLLMNIQNLIEDSRVDAVVRSNMMQFMARYLIDDPGTQQAVQRQMQGGKDEIQERVQQNILGRPSTLTPEATPAEVEVEVA